MEDIILTFESAGILETSFALPVIQRDFGISDADVQWVLASYMLVWVRALEKGHRGQVVADGPGLFSAVGGEIVRCAGQEERLRLRMHDVHPVQCHLHVYACKPIGSAHNV